MSRVHLGDVAIEHKETCKEDKSMYPIVGLEHLTPEQITLQNWDLNTENSFTKVFRKGNILFGRRRAYLKKAAVAPFDGICSGDITVIEAKEDKIIPELLPFVIQNDDLFDFAVGKSAGSLSPRVKWTHLQNYEFELPDKQKQHELAKVLWAIEDTRKSYQQLIKRTDELVKSQFIELFGTIEQSTEWKREKWSNVCEVRNGKDYKSVACDDGEYPVYGSGGYMGRATEYSCPENTVIVGRKGTIDKPLLVQEKFWNVDTAFGIIPNASILHYQYLYWFCKQFDFLSLNKGTTLPSTTKVDLQNIEINVPPMDLQERFALFVEQSDKSKFGKEMCDKWILEIQNSWYQMYRILHQ